MYAYATVVCSRSSERLKTRLSCFERSLLPDSRKIRPGLLGSLLTNVAHQVIDVVLHRLFALSHADVNQAQVRSVSNGSLTMIDNHPELACTPVVQLPEPVRAERGRSL